MWDAARATFWGGAYPTYPQGRCSRGRCKLGMREYMLVRSAKYGNVCRDCAAVLQFAPGLYHRNHRVVFQRGMVSGRAASGEPSTWWSALLASMGAGDLLTFDDAATLHLEDRRTRSYVDRFDASMRRYQRFLTRRHGVGTATKYKTPPEIYIQKTVPGMKDTTDLRDDELIERALRDLRLMLEKPVSHWCTRIDTKNRAFRDMVYELERKYVHRARFEHGSARVFDSEMVRQEDRNAPLQIGERTYHNCLVTRLYNPKKGLTEADGSERTPAKEDYDEAVYYATRRGPGGEGTEHAEGHPTMWRGDGYVTTRRGDAWVLDEAPEVPKVNNPRKQLRRMRQSRLFVTYSLHRPVGSEVEGRLIMERMADAAHELFGNDRHLAQLLVFGVKLGGFRAQNVPADQISKGRFEPITAPNKKDKVGEFYGQKTDSSYLYDTYETHVERVEVDGGIEIGPNRHHPHFHILLTVTHWSYVQLDYFKMNAYLELMFKGLDPDRRFGWGDSFKLLDASGGPFYTDSENPYVDIRLYPADNWNEVIAAYVRKSAVPSILEAIGTRTGQT